MPIELYSKSKEGRIALEQFNTEIGESKKKWNLTGIIAVWVLHLILIGSIELAFQV
jgi:hypothetical protein